MGRKDGGSAGRAEGEEGVRVFHSVETFFPLCGKIGKKFSMLWKTGGLFFRHGEGGPLAVVFDEDADDFPLAGGA